MEHERIPFIELAKMERGEIKITEEGKLQIDKWEALVKPPRMVPVLGSERTPVVTPILSPTPRTAGVTHIIRKNVFEIGLLPEVQVMPKAGSSVVYVSPFRTYTEPFYEKIKYVSIRINEINEISKEVYKNEKKFYKKEYGIKIPYEQFWDMYIKKHGDKSIPDVLANTNYETIACDYAKFISERIRRRSSIINKTKQVNFDFSAALPLSSQLLNNNDTLFPMQNDSFEIRSNYDKAAYDVSYLKRLDEYDLNRVYEYAQGRWMNSVVMAANLLDCNPNYNYPEHYRNGHELDYWLDHEHQAQRCKAVKQEIDRLRILEQQSHVQSAEVFIPTNHTVTPMAKNSFNGMPMEDVIIYFMQLATEKSANEKPFLTNDQVKAFVSRAFNGKTDLPKLYLNYTKGEKQFVWSLFYQFYVRCTTNYQYESTTKCKDKYIDLLSEHFTNFSRKELGNNFHKPTTRKWPITK